MTPLLKVRTPTIVAVALCAGEQSRASDSTFILASTEPLLKSLVPTDTCAAEALAFISPIDHQVTGLTPSILRNTAVGLLFVNAGLNPSQAALEAEALSRPNPRLSSPK